MNRSVFQQLRRRPSTHPACCAGLVLQVFMAGCVTLFVSAVQTAGAASCRESEIITIPFDELRERVNARSGVIDMTRDGDAARDTAESSEAGTIAGTDAPPGAHASPKTDAVSETDEVSEIDKTPGIESGEPDSISAISDSLTAPSKPLRLRPAVLDTLRYLAHRHHPDFPYRYSLTRISLSPMELPAPEVIGQVTGEDGITTYRKLGNHLSEGLLFPFAGTEDEIRILYDGVPLRSDFAIFRDVPVIAAGLFAETELEHHPPPSISGDNIPSLVVNLTSPLPDSLLPFSQVRMTMGAYELNSRLIHFRQNLWRHSNVQLAYRNVDYGGFRYNDTFEGGDLNLRLTHRFPAGRELSMSYINWNDDYGSPGPYYIGYETPYLLVERHRSQFQTSLHIEERGLWTTYVGEVDRQETDLLRDFSSGRYRERIFGMTGADRWNMNTGRYRHSLTAGFRIENRLGYHRAGDLLTGEVDITQADVLEKTIWIEDGIGWNQTSGSVAGLTVTDHSHCGRRTAPYLRATLPFPFSSRMSVSCRISYIPPPYEVLMGIMNMAPFRGYTRNRILFTEVETPSPLLRHLGIILKDSENLMAYCILPVPLFNYERMDGKFAGGWWKGELALPLNTILHLTGSYLWTRRDDTGEKIPYHPEYRISGKLSNQLYFFNRNLHTTIDVEGCHCASTMTPYGVQLDSYNKLDFTISTAVKTLNIYWTVRNILSEEYYDIAGYPRPGVVSEMGLVWNFWD